MSRKTNKAIHILLIIVLLPMLAENYLIALHYKPFYIHDNNSDQNDRFMPLLLWTNEPNMIITENGEEPIPGQENVDHLGRRYTGKDVENPEKRILILGCSYAYGMEIPDEDTFAYKLARFFPSWQFDNYASPGYGTHQCRIMLEKLMSDPNHPKYDYVLYAFIFDHPRRTAYDFSYIPDPDDNNHGTMPYADMSWDGKITYHSRDEMFIPGANFFRTLAFMNNLYARNKSIREQTKKNRNALYNAVLEDMLNLCSKNNIDLSVLILDDTNYTINPEIIKKGLNVYNIILYDLYIPKYHVKNNIYNHPNSLANDYWAEKIRAILNEKCKKDQAARP